MNETGVYDFKLEYTFAGDYMAELDRQLALLLSTREGTMPLDREFGPVGCSASALSISCNMGIKWAANTPGRR